MALRDKEGNETGRKDVTLTADEGVRADTTAEGLSLLRPGLQERAWWCRKASTSPQAMLRQLSDGASAQLVMDLDTAQKEGLPILGVYRGFQVAGCQPDEMGIGPVLRNPQAVEARGSLNQRNRAV
jgi:acetyl-CoA C-acetyltransferase